MQARGVVFMAPEQVAVQTIELPDPSPEEALIRVLYSGISIGTEGWILKNEYKGVTYPLVTGYQYCGLVEAVGSSVTAVKPGERVFGRHTRLVGNLRPMWGGHVSHAVADAKTLIPVPATMGADEASLGVMPGVPWRGIQMTGIHPGDLVVVIGLGLVGQFACQLARLQGGQVIALEVLEHRRAIARSHSAEVVLNPLTDDVGGRVKAVKAEGADVVIDTSANARAVNDSFEWIRRGGRYCLQGYYPGLTPLDLFLPHVKQLTFYNPTGFEGIETMFGFAAQGKLQIRPLITHYYDEEEAPTAYERMLRSPAEAVGMVLKWHEA